MLFRSIMEIYEAAEGIEVTRKGDDSPLTKADLAAHEIIVAGLQAIDSTPIVSEEGRVGEPMDSATCWLVDPLDGTKEFIKRNGMFTVNIALMRRDGVRWSPLFGVVHAPATDTTWFGGALYASERRGAGDSGPMAVRASEGVVRLVASGSHRGEKDESFAAAVGEPLGMDPTTAAVGIASFALVLAVRRFRPNWPDGLIVLAAATAAYAAVRFAVEFFRAKDDRFLGFLTLAQVISLVMVAVGVWGFTRLRGGVAGPGDTTAEA